MMFLQEMNLFFFCSVNKSRIAGFPEEECKKSHGQILFPDAALPKTGRQFQAVHRACSWILGGRGIIVISSEGIVFNYFCSAHSILDKLPLHRGAWQQGKADIALTLTCVMYTFQVTNIGVTPYDKVGSSYQQSVFWHSIHFYFFKLKGS